jgi:hypothetical protein
MAWVEDGDIAVVRSTPRAIEIAISYISLAREAGISLKAIDAIHLHHAIEWAHETGDVVAVATGDAAFARFSRFFPATGTFIAIEEINVTQPPVPGTTEY